MRAVIQRVKSASVKVDGRITGEIRSGLLVLLGVARTDTDKDAQYMADKVAGLRIFTDEAGKFNLSLADTRGSILVVSQFTLYGDARGGRRPSFTQAAGADLGNMLYEAFMQMLGEKGFEVRSGEFGAHMDVELINDGPVTILLDSSRQF